MDKTFLVITSIAEQNNPVLEKFARESSECNIPFIVIGDKKSPKDFNLKGCDYYSIKRQQTLSFGLVKGLPYNHYARKNLGYLIAMSQGAEIIMETDDDNIPLEGFWNRPFRTIKAHLLENTNWVNVYKYFTDAHIWARGFSLENIQDNLPPLENQILADCPIQQGLTDENPDVDAIYRLTMPLPFRFKKSENIALGNNSICPVNSQNTTWFKEAFPLLYLPSGCSFRMTDIWRSFIAQRIAWTCGWSVLFRNSTMWHQRHDHNLLDDFRDEISGYENSALLCHSLKTLDLKPGKENIPENMIRCYTKMVDLNLVDKSEIILLKAWIKDVCSCLF
jgi:hypothetical protein